MECNPDELLVKIYGFYRRSVRHSYGKSRIGKILEREQDLLALVDQDPDGTPIPYFKNTTFTILRQEYGYTIKSDTRRGHTIVELQPYLEEWIIDACREASIDIRDYNLPNNPISLHNIINKNLKVFKRLVEDLLNHECRVKWLKDDILNL